MEDSDVERPAKKTSSQGNRKAREGDIQIRRDTEVLLEGKTKGKAMGKLMRGEKGKEKAMETLEDVKMVDDAMEVDRPMAVKIEVDKPKSTIPGHSVGVIQIKPMSPRKSVGLESWMSIDGENKGNEEEQHPCVQCQHQNRKCWRSRMKHACEPCSHQKMKCSQVPVD